MDNTTFARAIYTALPYFLQLEAVQYLNADQEAFKHEKETLSNFFPEYEFIIVGGGTAGCILANRLSLHHTVLLLEAGGPPPTLVQVPAFVASIPSIPLLNYKYYSTPQAKAGNRRIPQPMARMLGGCHSHNGLAHNRGHSRGYDIWAILTKDPSWKYQNLLKYFKKSENYSGMFPSDQHGTTGPVQIETSKAPPVSTWLEAGKQLGFKVIDPNGPQTVGVAAGDRTIKEGRRQSTYKTYVEPILETRKNLKVLKYAKVVKILIKKHHAYGVKYERHGVILKAFASKEVIISAGVYGTPMLLFKSRVGPKAMLKKAGIRSIVDLPVGKYLQDHHGVTVGPFILNTNQPISQEYLSPTSFEKYFRFEKESVLSEDGVFQGFFTSSLAQARNEPDWPDLYFDPSRIGSNQYRIVVQVTRPPFDPNSLGSIELNHTAYKAGVRDDTELAVIDIKFYENPSYSRIALDGIHLALNLLNTKAFQSLGFKLLPDSECAAVYGFKTDLYWGCLAQKTGFTVYHTVGTCRMGPGGDDKESVVDSKLRVLGIQRLRIVDASVMPVIPNSNPNAPVMMIAEKAAASIIRFYRRQRLPTLRTTEQAKSKRRQSIHRRI